VTRLRRFWRENWFTLTVLAALTVAFLALRSSPTEIASVEAFESSLMQGRPTVIVFYSNT